MFAWLHAELRHRELACALPGFTQKFGKVKIDGLPIPKGRLVKCPYRTICRDCVIYFSITVLWHPRMKNGRTIGVGHVCHLPIGNWVTNLRGVNLLLNFGEGKPVEVIFNRILDHWRGGRGTPMRVKQPG